MSDTTTSPSSSPTVRKKRSLRNYVLKNKQECEERCFDTLSPRHLIKFHSTVQKRQDTESLVDFVLQALGKIYSEDPLGVKIRTIDFLRSMLPQLKIKIQQRLSLLNYLQQSLKYKPLSEIDMEMQKEWQKNVLLYSLMAIWSRCMLLHQFQNEEYFLQEYNKQRNLIANVTNHYFRSALSVHEAKGGVFDFIYEDSAHQIINSLKNWREIYTFKLLPLLKIQKGMEHEQRVYMNFDFNTLDINEQYIDSEDQANQLQQTTLKIKAFSQEFRIHQRIALLKQIRSTFLNEIEGNHKKIAERRSFSHVSSLEKDDIIGCMIYCIIKGQLKELQKGLKALTLLLGNNQLLSKKGVDSYRADLESAVQHLSEVHLSFFPILQPKESLCTNL